MSSTMLKVENVSKYYYLGKLGYSRLRDDIKNWLGKKDSENAVDHDQKIWALKNINFEIEEGEVLGIIGNNGAGKSTLLKIISRITAPSSGCVMGNGRVASLLEVGTGFHGELTGRENIYLNGHILGMKRKEIDARFDEIVDFSGVERFLDTPAKRYSSGMYTRLAFAVAAHMNPDILIVDEVLAVGDAEFQQKSIGKMQEVSSKQGKTILLVSHHMQALQNLCSRIITLHNGEMINMGKPETVISEYLKKEKTFTLKQEYEAKEAAPGNDEIRIKKVELIPRYLPGQTIIDIRTPLDLVFDFWCTGKKINNLTVGVHLFNIAGECIFEIVSQPIASEIGLMKGTCSIPGNFLNDGSYYLSIMFIKDSSNWLYYFEACINFDVEDYRINTAWYGKWMGHVRPSFPVLISASEE